MSPNTLSPGRKDEVGGALMTVPEMSWHGIRDPMIVAGTGQVSLGGC